MRTHFSYWHSKNFPMVQGTFQSNDIEKIRKIWGMEMWRKEEGKNVGLVFLNKQEQVSQEESESS